MNQKPANLNAASNISLLIVEDNKLQAEMLRKKLSKEGFQIRVATNGKAALEAIQEVQPDLVLSDIRMPEMDGYQLCQAIKSDEKLQHIPVIMLSAISDNEDIVHGIEAGADAYLTKPCKSSALLSRISDLLEYRTQTLASGSSLHREDETVRSVKATIGGKTYSIKTDKKQALTLLLSTFQNAVEMTDEIRELRTELSEVQRELKVVKGKLADSQIAGGLKAEQAIAQRDQMIEVMTSRWLPPIESIRFSVGMLGIDHSLPRSVSTACKEINKQVELLSVLLEGMLDKSAMSNHSSCTNG